VAYSTSGSSTTREDEAQRAAAAAASSGSSAVAELLMLRDHFSSIGVSARSFVLGDTLGTGTFGRVSLVSYTYNKRVLYFALKCLKKSEIIRLKQVDHIKSEKSILERIAHPFIVSLYTSFSDERCLYMLMEFVIGGELFSQLRKAGRFVNDTARFYAAEIALAFAYLHENDIAYRDLKPENLLIDKDGHIKITDFGFAKVVPDRTWTLCGTPEYLAPEIIQSKGHGKAVDWWALGILIYEMLAGYPPFYDENPFGIYQKILGGRIEFPRHFDPYAKELVKKLLVADRTKRLGCLRDGAEDVKNQKWFKGIDWVACYQRKIKPPYVPLARAPNDTSHFDKYPDSAGEDDRLSAKDQALFDDF
jgi:serine/threonine protein kinase